MSKDRVFGWGSEFDNMMVHFITQFFK